MLGVFLIYTLGCLMALAVLLVFAKNSLWISWVKTGEAQTYKFLGYVRTALRVVTVLVLVMAVINIRYGMYGCLLCEGV